MEPEMSRGNVNAGQHVKMIPGRKAIIPTRILVATCLMVMALCVPLLWVGMWQAKRHHRDCLKFLEEPILFVGAALLVASLLGLLGAVHPHKPLVWIYIVAVFLSIVLLLAFTLFAWFVTMGGGGRVVPGASYQEYRLGDFTLWFQSQTRNPAKWAGMRSCIQDKKPCSKLDTKYPTHADFNNAKLSSIQSGCCKPPNACAFTFVTPTHWENTTHANATGDCGRWDNNPSLLCYGCTSCRAGLLQNVKEDWSRVMKVCLIVLLLLAISYIVAWVGFLRALWNDIYNNQDTNDQVKHSPKCLSFYERRDCLGPVKAPFWSFYDNMGIVLETLPCCNHQ